MADDIPDSTTPWRRSRAEIEAALQQWARDFRGEGAPSPR
jgi:hypothetical protein